MLLRPANLLVLAAGLAAACGAPRNEPAAPQSSAGRLTIDRLIEIKHPSQPSWSPDGRLVAFVWDRGGAQNLYVIDTGSAAAGAPRRVTVADAGTVEDLFWTKDARTLYFVSDGDLWRLHPGDGAPPEPVWQTPDNENQVVPSPDFTRVAFVRGGIVGVPDWQRTVGDLWIRSLADGRETRLTGGQGVVASPSWASDGRQLAFALAKVDLRTDAPTYSGAKILYSRTERGPSVPAVIPAGGGRRTDYSPGHSWEAQGRWLDATRLLVQRVSLDNRQREIAVVDTSTGKDRVIVHEEDPKFWSVVSAEPLVSPDGTRVAFVSDRDGWDHLYVVAVNGGPPLQVTHGAFEVRDPSWASDSTRLAFSHNEEGQPGVWHLAVATIRGDQRLASVADVTSGRGTDMFPVWSPDGSKLIYQHTDPQTSADLFLVPAVGGKQQGVRLTDSMPSGVDHRSFVEPELVKYQVADGKQVPAYLFVPTGLDRSKRHPAIIWIHGDGVNQNYDGWHVERNYAVYYSFHQYLLQQGYVVLAPDYRGSIGYGRDWRQQVYMDVGGKDARDAASGADYLRTLSYVDPDRIGVWGLSYGGFFTLLAMIERPTTFRCGVDVAGVPDFRMWYEDPGGSWVTSRMGTPGAQPAVYAQAAPIDRIDRLARPLLILHGTADVNVPFLESVRLTDAILKAGKDLEFMVYPGEFHYFQRAHVLRDAWQRAQRFFDKHLEPGHTP